MVSLYALNEAQLGAGAQVGDPVVSARGAAGDGKATQITAIALAGIDQTVPPVIAQALNGGSGQTTLAGTIATTAQSSIVLTAFGLGDAAAWAPGAGETRAGYAAYAAAPSGGGGTPGGVVESFVYGPYGEGAGDGDPAGMPFRYAGHRFDAQTGLVYMRARYYSVTLGRFLSPG